MNKTGLFHEISKRHLYRSSTNIPVGLLFLLTVLGLLFILFVVALIRHIRTKHSDSASVQGPYRRPYVIPLDRPPSYEDIIKERTDKVPHTSLPPSYEQSCGNTC